MTTINITDVPVNYVLRKLTKYQKERISVHYQILQDWNKRPENISKIAYMSVLARKYCVSKKTIELIIYKK